ARIRFAAKHYAGEVVIGIRQNGIRPYGKGSFESLELPDHVYAQEIAAIEIQARQETRFGRLKLAILTLDVRVVRLQLNPTHGRHRLPVHDRRKQEPACIMPHISSADETQRRIIILPDARECDARSVSIILKAQSDMACDIIKTRVILPDVREPRAELAIAPESVLRVDSGGAIEAIGTLQIRKDTAHSRPGEDVGSDAGNAVVGAARAEKLVHPRTRLDVEQPDGYAPYLPREAGAREDLLIQTNSPREEGLGRLRCAVLEEAR